MPDILEQMIDYSRQREMASDIWPVHDAQHVIVGCGGIGYWLAIQLAMMGAVKMVLIDGDRVEASNLNRITVPLRLSGEWNVKALKMQLRLLRPKLHITCLPVHVTEDTLTIIRTAGVHIWDCTDDARIQRILSRYATSHSANYTKAGYEGWDVGLYSKMEDTWLQDNYTPGYTTSKANVLSSMMAAGLAIMYGLSRQNRAPRDVHINLMNMALEGNVRATEEVEL